MTEIKYLNPRISEQFKYTGRKSVQEKTIVNVSGVHIGGNEIVIIAGPCSVENEEQTFQTAQMVQKCGAAILRGGAFKPRTSPYSFQGLHDEGAKILARVRRKLDIPVVSEVMDTRKVTLMADCVDILQVGSRNMHNSALLEEVGKSGKPVLLKRGMSATVEEFLFAAEYIMKQGNTNVILCERGIRTFEMATRFTLDISAIPLLKRYTHLPLIVDPSHSAGHWWLVPELAKAAIAAGADGLLIEAHHDPSKALCDGEQSLNPETFCELMKGLIPVALAVGRNLSGNNHQ